MHKKKPIGQTILSVMKTNRTERMIEQATVRFTETAEDIASPVAVDPAASKITEKTVSAPDVESASLIALQALATEVGGKFSNKSFVKKYHGHTLTITYMGYEGSNAIFSYVLSKNAETVMRFEIAQYFSKYSEGAGGNKFSITLNSYRLEDALRVGEQAYAYGFCVSKDTLVALNMIKLDLSLTNKKRLY